MIGRNPSATQPREPDGKYATTGRPSRRDKGWRTDPGYDVDNGPSEDEPDTPSEAKAARATLAPPKPRGMPKRGRSRFPESESGKRLMALRERGYRGPIDQDGYATTEAEFEAKYKRDKAQGELEDRGPDCEEDGDRYFQQCYDEAEATYQREKKKGDKLRAKWGQVPDPGPVRVELDAVDVARRVPDPEPRRHQRVGQAAKKAGAAMRPADRAADRFAKKLVRAGARKLAKTTDKSEVT